MNPLIHETENMSAGTLNTEDSHMEEIVRDSCTSQTPFVELSEKELQEELQRKRQEYLTEKLTRKREIAKLRRQKFGASSSQEDDVGGSQSDSVSDKRHSNVEQQRNYCEKQRISAEIEIPIKQDKISVMVQGKKSKDWIQEQLLVDELSLTMGDNHYLLKDFHKIKVIAGTIIADCHRLKLSHVSLGQIMLGVSVPKLYYGLPMHYYVMAFIIQQKLQNMGLKLSKVMQQSVPGVPETAIKNCQIYGKILKKPQIIGKWEQRLIVINQEGIFSYKRFNEKHSMFIAASSLKEIWTRFEIEEDMLVIKLLHSNSTKTEFGIPLTLMLDTHCWLYHFYMLAFRK